MRQIGIKSALQSAAARQGLRCDNRDLTAVSAKLVVRTLFTDDLAEADVAGHPRQFAVRTD